MCVERGGRRPSSKWLSWVGHFAKGESSKIHDITLKILKSPPERWHLSGLKFLMADLHYNFFTLTLSLLLFLMLLYEYKWNPLGGQTGNIYFCEILVTSPVLCPGGNNEVSIDKRYNGTTGRILNNQRLKISINLKNRESINFVFLWIFLHCVKTDIPCFLPWELQIENIKSTIFCKTQLLKTKSKHSNILTCWFCPREHLFWPHSSQSLGSWGP